jgi:hypothetical protein
MKCQHDTTKSDPTVKPQYPDGNGAMRYWCPVCACWFTLPLTRALSENHDPKSR